MTFQALRFYQKSQLPRGAYTSRKTSKQTWQLRAASCRANNFSFADEFLWSWSARKAWKTTQANWEEARKAYHTAPEPSVTAFFSSSSRAIARFPASRLQCPIKPAEGDKLFSTRQHESNSKTNHYLHASPVRKKHELTHFILFFFGKQRFCTFADLGQGKESVKLTQRNPSFSWGQVRTPQPMQTSTDTISYKNFTFQSLKENFKDAALLRWFSRSNDRMSTIFSSNQVR